MKQKVQNIKQQSVYKRRRVTLVVALILLAMLIVVIYASTSYRNNKVAKNNILIDNPNVISVDPNPPALGAGMIPIKWNGTNWVITTANDKKWYDYSNGKWATVMLSDGKYSSELERDKILASDVVGADASVRPEDMGSIFIWIPRLCYNDTRIEFLKETSILEYKWTTENCFNLERYGANGLDLAFTGIWVGQTEYSTTKELEAKNEEMNKEENKQGLIANEKVLSLTASDKVAVEKLYQKTVGVETLIDPNNQTILQDISTMKNRQTIKIVNTNNRVPIIGTYKIDNTNKTIQVGTKYSKYGISYILDEEGNIVTGGIGQTNEDETLYVYYIVDTEGNIKRYPVSYGLPTPDLRYFVKGNTYYVTYDENGNEYSTIPIGEPEPEGWYSYEEQKWANIVVRDNGLENYYVWIPRYMYKLNLDGTETVDAKIVDLNNIYIDPKTGKETNLNNTDYILPEAFTWEDPKNSNNKVELRGFWASKYKLRNDGSYGLIASVSAGESSIKVNGFVAKGIGTPASYEVTLIREDGTIVDTVELKEKLEHTFSGLGKVDENGNKETTYYINLVAKNEEDGVLAGYSTQVSLAELVVDLEGFDKSTTFYVTYDEKGNEESYIPIGEDAPNGWYNYADQKWANIVVRENGLENYYVWIPRYEYKLDQTNQKTQVQLISTDKVIPDTGYTIPEAFTWEDPDNENEKVQLSGFWASKYKLRPEDSKTYMPGITGKPGTIYVKDILSNFNEEAYKNYIYEMYLINDGKRINVEPIPLTGNYEFSGLPGGMYTVNIIVKEKIMKPVIDEETGEPKKDENGNVIKEDTGERKYIRGIAKKVDIKEFIPANKPDLSGFNPNLTYYVTYDSLGNETSNIPIKDAPPENWYNYEVGQKWANIVVRDKGIENYYVWIPRYEYKLDRNDPNQKTDVQFIATTQKIADEGYTIPDAFTWEKTVVDENGKKVTETNEAGEIVEVTEKVQLSGFWASKYKLRNDSNSSDNTLRKLDATVSVSNKTIRVSNIVPKNTKDGIFFKVRLIQDGKTIAGPTTITSGMACTFEVPEYGKYAISITQGTTIDGQLAGFAKEIIVNEIKPPELTGFRVDTTYIVTYDEGNESHTQPIKDVLKEGAEIDSNTQQLVSGEIDVNKISGVWYDYANQKWANIYTINDGIENYYTWIPRYEYQVDKVTEKTDVILITQEQVEPDIGYIIPDAFTWERTLEDGSTETVQLSGFWASKYKLREK